MYSRLYGRCRGPDAFFDAARREDLVTVMWASEPFDPEHPDTYFEPV